MLQVSGFQPKLLCLYTRSIYGDMFRSQKQKLWYIYTNILGQYTTMAKLTMRRDVLLGRKYWNNACINSKLLILIFYWKS